MAATPFKATITIVDARGAAIATYNMSASDVANAFLTNDDDGLTFIDLPNRGGMFLGDIFLSADGVDTKRLELWGGGLPTNNKFRDAALASAANVKRIAPVPLKPKGRIQFKQLA